MYLKYFSLNPTPYTLNPERHHIVFGAKFISYLRVGGHGKYFSLNPKP